MPTRRLFAVLGAIATLLAACAPAPAPVTVTAPASPSANPSPLPTLAPTLTPAATAASVPPITLPDAAAYQWAQVMDGFQAPLDIRSPGDGSGRLFIVEQGGVIRILLHGQVLPQPFLDITGRAVFSGSEQGLLGLAFHPRFAQNGYFYVNYTDSQGNTHISRFTASANSADPQTEKEVLFVQQPFGNHNGGALAFGADGYLYIGLGDGGSAGDPYDNAQSVNTLLGKILRVDVDNGDPYAIPADNPFASGGGMPEIWAYGLRNPWRFSFDPLTNHLWVADVGQNEWEEVNRLAAPANLGWNEVEGSHTYQGSSRPEYWQPLAEYSHGYGCSVTGGAVYRGDSLPAWQGVYLLGDYCSGNIWGIPADARQGETLQLSQTAPLFQTNFRISTFGVDDEGELYLADYNTGVIYRLQAR